MCRHPCLVLDLSLESIQSFTLSMMLAVDFSVGALDQTEEVPLYSWFSEVVTGLTIWSMFFQHLSK